MKPITKTLYSICILLAITFSVKAQNFTVLKSSNIIVEGTSTLHDWEMKTATIKAVGKITHNGNQITGFQKIAIAIPVETLKSGKKAMDENCYKALKSKEHANILFTLSEVTEINEQNVTATGKLTIAGITHSIKLEGVFDKTANGIHTLSGSVPLLMSDYNVEPPSFMMGTIKTGNEIIIKYTVKLIISNTSEL